MRQFKNLTDFTTSATMIKHKKRRLSHTKEAHSLTTICCTKSCSFYHFSGPFSLTGQVAYSKVVNLCVEDLDYMGRIKELNECLDKVKTIVKPGCSQDVVKATLSAMSTVTDNCETRLFSFSVYFLRKYLTSWSNWILSQNADVRLMNCLSIRFVPPLALVGLVVSPSNPLSSATG
ncbi:hypothetical protein L1987_37886 [Smallanthus sonchifolius]|uniref:Uncharacterized protein n=1 Tax=Smallanthus sonchifolius TaxID=185202 RepID=A0ACB9HK64_9ASTR|nr:hypothetical protein L1987_37886 [Smallanthus sonchifolius]